MPSFSPSSLSRLASCHEDLQEIFHVVVKNFDCSIICGHRDKAEQDRVFREKLSKVEWPNSKHNSYPSMAVDVAPYPVDWKNLERFRYFGFYVKGIAAGMYKFGLIQHELRWGGDWDGDNDTRDQMFNDLVHFELIEIKQP